MKLIDYQGVLTRMGLSVTIVPNSQGGLLIRYNGLTFVFEHYESSDPFYFRFVLPGIANDTTLRSIPYEVINELNLTYKVAKIVNQGGQYHIVAEQFIFDYTTIEPVIRQVLSIMTQEVAQFHQRITH